MEGVLDAGEYPTAQWSLTKGYKFQGEWNYTINGICRDAGGLPEIVARCQTVKTIPAEGSSSDDLEFFRHHFRKRHCTAAGLRPGRLSCSQLILHYGTSRKKLMSTTWK